MTNSVENVLDQIPPNTQESVKYQATLLHTLQQLDALDYHRLQI